MNKPRENTLDRALSLPDRKALRECERWNRLHPIGTTVAHHPAMKIDRVRTTASPAYAEGPAVLIRLDGEPRPVLLDACDVIPPQ